jgi:hypothetical protein
MTSRSAVPSLVLIPGNSKDDYHAIFAIALAYAKSGLLISEKAKSSDEPEYAFPAVVCSSFSIELFLKAFIALENAEAEAESRQAITGHPLVQLWNKISLARQSLIAGMFRNPIGDPLTNASDVRIRFFVEALTNVGLQPFVKWRYVHEFRDITHMSHAALVEITDALSHAATYLLKEKSAANANGIGLNKILREHNVAPTGDSGPLLLGRDSPLRQVPSNCASHEVLLLDGIRHALEIMDITFARLRGTLTNLALSVPEPTALPDVIAHVFLDAWGFVHAVLRFEKMYRRLTSKNSAPAPDMPTLKEAISGFQQITKFSNGLGELSWLTGFQLTPEAIALHCTLIPGTHLSPPEVKTEPFLSTLDWPTDCIKLKAHGYEANLSAVRKHIGVRLIHLESQLEQAFKAGKTHAPIINDAYIARPVKMQSVK